MHDTFPGPMFALLDRFLEPAGKSLTPEIARWLVGLKADEDLQARVDELASRSASGELTAEEADEYDLYLKANHVLGVLQSQARKALATAK